MSPEVVQQLQQEVHTPFHEALLTHCRGLVDMSRRKMSCKYAEWDRFDDTYRGLRVLDKQDEKAREKKEPTKMTVPITRSQIQTFVAFGYSVLFQRESFFELLAMEEAAERSARVGEALLQRDLTYNNFSVKTYQFLLDVARFGIAIFKCGWTQKMQWVKQQETIPARAFLGIPVRAEQTIERKVQQIKYQGNEVRNVSPYRFFPDVRLPLCDFQKGEFCASEDEISYVELRQMEFEGAVAGIDYVQTMANGNTSDERKRSRLSAAIIDPQGKIDALANTKGTGVLTEVQVKLIPAEFMIDKDIPLGPEKYPVKYLIWYINDQRVIRVEPLEYLHDEFTYTIAEFTPDIHHFVNDGLASDIDALQDVISWFINSHITSVRRVIQNQLVVDPQMVNMDDVAERRPIIRLVPGTARLGIERALHQLDVSDVTQNHMQDAEVVQSLVQIVTGINDNALGQFHTGRRSATEARNVSSGTASRLKTTISTIYHSAFDPLGRQMLSNLRDGLTLDVYVKLFGLLKDPTFTEYFEFAKVSNKDLVGDFDFAIFDGTLPSEKFYTAETLQELVSLLVGAPDLAVLLGFDIRQLVFEVLRLRGVRHPERFTMEQLQRQLAIQQLTMMGGSTAPPNEPNGQPQNGVRTNGTGQPSGSPTRVA